MSGKKHWLNPADPDAEIGLPDNSAGIGGQTSPPEFPNPLERVSLNPQPEPPGPFDLGYPPPEPDFPNPLERVSLNPQPEPPGPFDLGNPPPEPDFPNPLERVSLNPQPEPPGPLDLGNLQPPPEPEFPNPLERVSLNPQPEPPMTPAQGLRLFGLRLSLLGIAGLIVLLGLLCVGAVALAQPGGGWQGILAIFGGGQATQPADGAQASQPAPVSEGGSCFDPCDPAAPRCVGNLACLPRADGSHICYDTAICSPEAVASEAPTEAVTPTEVVVEKEPKDKDKPEPPVFGGPPIAP